MNILSGEAGNKMLLLGNEAIARAALEAGVETATTYPGTPSTEIGEALAAASENWPLYFEYSINEKVALEVAAGASLTGMRSICSMKHVGLNVASDVLASLPYLGVIGGLVVVSADDPFCHSSQNEQDNRYYARMFKLPMLEPSSPAEAYSMTKAGFEISEAFGLPLLLRTTTRISHMRGVVTLDELKPPKHGKSFTSAPDRLVLIPSIARELHILLEDKMDRLRDRASRSPFNSITGEGSMGIIASGVSANYAIDTVRDLGLDSRVRLLKLGFTHPLPEDLIGNFLEGLERVLIIEELEPYMEGFCEQIAYRRSLPVEILGKRSGHLKIVHEFGPNMVTAAVADMAGRIYQVPKGTPHSMPVPTRAPSLCNGCPHRATYYASKLVTENNAIFSNDIGCYTLGTQSPLNMADFNLCMGASVGLGSGFSIGDQRPVIGFIGDSTFFHSGLAGLINAIRNKTNITLVIMDNDTTAMTGSQPHPGSSNGPELTCVPIENLVEAANIGHMEIVDPLDLKATVEAMRRAIDYKGPSVVISRSPCLMNLSEDEKEKRSRIAYEVDPVKCGTCSIPGASGCGIETDALTELRRSRNRVCEDDAPSLSAPCSESCPAGVCVPGYLARISVGDVQGALDIIRESIPLPAVCGLVCDRPCESACHEKNGGDPVAIRELKRVVSMNEDLSASAGRFLDRLKGVERKGKRVAVVGSGPAGLGAAFELVRRGYDVSVFEREPEIGGMLRHGIPDFRLPREVLNAEIGFLRMIGIEFVTNFEIGKEAGLADLFEKGFDALFVGTGAHKGLHLGVRGERSPGVWNALVFLKRCNTGDPPRLGQKIVVVGGGDTAIDSARTALRTSPSSQVTILYRRDRENMKGRSEEIKAAIEEGALLEVLKSPISIHFDDEGNPKALDIRKMTLTAADESGRPAPVPVDGETSMLECDSLIVAIGQAPEFGFLEGNGSAVDQRFTALARDGLVEANTVDGSTTVEGVFAGGDNVTGPSTVVEAIAAGRRGAYGIDRFLSGVDVPKPDMPEDVRPAGGAALPADLYLQSVEEAVAEASHCRTCGPCGQCRNCIDNFACGAITLIDGHVAIDAPSCTACGLCEQLCPNGAISKTDRQSLQGGKKAIHAA
ncbi:indolepyruvate ferredoxin oxidoreductase subunit alpha [Thermodesulfobacteriota bacterium]